MEHRGGLCGGGAVRAVLALSLLGGCAVGPDFKKPEVTVGDKWQAANDPRVASQTAADTLWWRGFEDPALDRLVELAYRQNLPLQVAGLRIAEARAQLGVATGKQFPQTQQVGGGVTAFGLSENQANVSNFDQTFGSYHVGFDAAWELDFWGKYRRGVQAEAATLLASLSDYYSALVSLSAEVARTYVMVRTFEVRIIQGEENAKIQEEALSIAQSRFRTGATSELDPTQATTLLESTRATIPMLHIGLQQSRNALNRLLGQPPGTVEPILAGPKRIPKAPPKVAVGVPAEMLRRRPDIRGAELLAAAQCAKIGVAKAELYPSFSLFGTIGLRSRTPENLLSSNSIYYNAGPQFNLPLFNYGRLTNAVRVEDARFQQLLVGYRETVVRAAQEVEDALSGFLNAQQSLAFGENAVKSAQTAVQMAVVMYREGAADYQRVLEAQRALLAEQNALTNTSSSMVVSLIALYKALGGGWQSHLNRPVVPQETERVMKDRTNWGDMLSEPRSVEKKEHPAQAAQESTP